MNTENDIIVQFLQKHEEDIYETWKDKFTFSPDESLKDTILSNSRAIYALYLLKLQHSEMDLIEEIKALSMKIASERVKTGVHIRNVLANISTVKQQIANSIKENFKELSKTHQWTSDLETIFDSLIFHTASYFADLQNEIIQKQNEILSEAHKERLTLLGQMTSSFVHEFRNPLTSIKGFIQLLKADYPDLHYLDIIYSELEQLNTRISEFLAFSRKGEVEQKFIVFSLDRLIDEVITFLYPSIVDINVHVETFVENDIFILGQLEEIRQVLLNIIFNALDVLHNIQNPTITISSKKNEANIIQLIITNNGPRISEELIADIFKPFMTTKDIGTGLGLFVCKQIIEKHNGTLICVSTETSTSFIITLPISHFT
ncbi:ATP-binding protein [Bacillus massiliigorillae]|uniref:ATP-binding protein n=1 Tax=Bacillus massiliigorillae TaxID=1243664 RepID=UPI0003A46E87|nr:ATP-binding protein [Bacillus massiliigorillae]